jgi:hypothetical protein
LESEALELSDLYFTGDDYRYHFDAHAKQRYIDMIRECFNAGAPHKGRFLKWDTVIEEVLGLSRFLIGKSSRLDFNEPSPSLQRFDNIKLRERIRSLTAEEAKRAGIGKSTLYTLRQHVRYNRSFKLYPKVRCRLESLEPATV